MLQETPRIAVLVLIALSMLVSCSREDPSEDPDSTASGITNRVAVPAQVVANLGITFARAKRGKVGSWIPVPGELYVPGTHRWHLRAPAHGRLKGVSQRWKKVEAGEVVAEILSPQLREAQQDLLAVHSRRAYAERESEAANARFAEGEAQLRAVTELQKASIERFEHLRKLNRGANAFATKELLESQRASVEAGKAALEAAVRRDELREAARQKDLLRAQVQLRVDQSLRAFSLLSGRTPEELLVDRQGTAAWKTLESIVVRAPSNGAVVEVPVSTGETVETGDVLALVLDTTELRFRGWVPEGDIRLLRHGAAVRVELPGGIAPIDTELLGPLPVADSVTRRVQVEATVSSPGKDLPQGLSATAHVQVQESVNEEVLVPRDCVVIDGLEMIVFRRDPNDASFVIRTPVDLGLRGAGAVEVLSGVLAADFVVRKGVHQLKQAGIGKAPQGGHFHADGSWHVEHE